VAARPEWLDEHHSGGWTRDLSDQDMPACQQHTGDAQACSGMNQMLELSRLVGAMIVVPSLYGYARQAFSFVPHSIGTFRHGPGWWQVVC
jgi:hypothetical protein